MDIDIMIDLMKAKRPLTLRQISKRNNISWVTAKKHVNNIDNFYSRDGKVISIKKTRRRTEVKANDSFLDFMKEVRRECVKEAG